MVVVPIGLDLAKNVFQVHAVDVAGSEPRRAWGNGLVADAHGP
jgi:hypothetical protein